MNAFSLLVLSVILFVSTNVDDLFALVAFFADVRFKRRNIIIGQYLGIGLLIIISMVGSLISLFLAPTYVGVMGVFPIMIGTKKFLDLIFKGYRDNTQPLKARDRPILQIASIIGVTIANGGDNISVYAPLFATRSAGQIVTIIIIFAAMTTLWMMIAHWLVNHRTIGAPLRRYGELIVPFLLITIGVAVLYDTGLITLLRHKV